MVLTLLKSLRLPSTSESSDVTIFNLSLINRIVFSAILFLFLAVLHWFGSLTYCRGCVVTYTAYFYCFGVIGSLGFLNTLWTLREQKKKLFYGATFLLAVLAGLNFWTQKEHVHSYTTYDPYSYLSRVKRIAKMIKDHTSVDDQILILGESDPVGVHAAFYSETFFVF